jgi:hypothetical protein
MSMDRAADINRRLVNAYMIWAGITCGPVPDVRGISLADAREAARVVREAGPERLPNGASRHTLTVNDPDVDRLFAWIILNGKGNG